MRGSLRAGRAQIAGRFAQCGLHAVLTLSDRLPLGICESQ